MHYATTFVKPRRGIATILLLMLVMWSLGLPMLTKSSASAASLTWVSDVLSDSGPAIGSDHTINFRVPSGMTAGGSNTITVTLPTGFVTTGTDDTDIDVLVNGASKTVVAGAPGANEWQATWGAGAASTTLTLTIGNAETIAANATTTILIGQNATGGAGNARITNHPTPGSYVISIAGTGNFVDSADTRIMIVSHVTLTAQVATTFQFTVNGTTTAEQIGAGDNTTTASTATTLPFGLISPGAVNAKVLAQRLDVVTNAAHGFSVTVHADSNLASATGADINPFIDNAATAVPAAWQSPAGTIDTDTTYGHEGITSSDNTTNQSGTPAEFVNGTRYAGNFVAAPREVFYHSGPIGGHIDSSGGGSDNEGRRWCVVGYKIEIDALQEAATDYTQVLHYVATPTF